MTLDITPPLKAIESLVSALALFEAVNLHEPKNAPGKGLRVAIFLDEIGPSPQASGQAATAGRVVFKARVFSPMISKPEGMIDQNLGNAVAKIMEALTGGFALGGTVRNIDLLGETGTPLSAKGGYVDIDATKYRFMDITIPLVFNDVWSQEA